MPQRGAVLAAALGWAWLTGCATLTAKKEFLRVDSEPRGASVRVNGQGGGCTPALVEVDKAHPQLVEVAVPGQPPHACDVRMSPAPGYVVADVLLCVLLFPIGCISFIDAAGAWNELDCPACVARFEGGPYPPLCTPPPGAPRPPAPPGPPGYPPPPVPPPPPAPRSHD